MRTVLAAALATALAGVLLVAPAGGLPAASASVPNPAGLPATVTQDALPTVQINGVVWSQAVVGGVVFAGGSFTSARPAGSPAGRNETPRANLLAYDITTGELITSFAPQINGQVKAVAASPDGTRLYVGGDFTTVDGAPRTRIAAFDTATGRLVPGWQPLVGTTVNAIAATSSTVYFGGLFSKVNNTARTRLAAVVASSGALTSWAPSVAGSGATVLSLTLNASRSKVVVAGQFTQVNGATSNGMGAVDPVSGASLPWPASRSTNNGTGPRSGIWSVSSDDRNVYATGFVDNDITRGNLEGTMAVDGESGEISWVNNCFGDSYTTFATGGVVYVGSHAHDCGPAQLFPEAGTATSNAYHQATAWSQAPSTVSNVGTQRGWDWTGYKRSNLLQFDPRWRIGTFTKQYQAVWQISGNADYVVMGGEFLAVNGKNQQGLVRFAKHGRAPGAFGPVQANLGTLSAAAGQVDGRRTVTASLSRATFDPDDTYLEYRLLRNGDAARPVATTRTVTPGFWERDAGVPVTLTDTDPPLQVNTYQVVAVDGGGRSVATGTVSVSPPPGALGVSATSLDLGAVAVGSTASLPLTISNTGGTPVTVTRVTAPASPYAVTPDLTGTVLRPGASATATVTYAPTGASNGDTASLVLASDDGRSPTTVALRGSTLGGAVNLAQGRTATQSSTFSGGAAGRAVDGSTAGSWANGSVTHTDTDPASWWQVDLGASRSPSQVVVWNRTDCCTDRLRDYWVFTSDAPFDTALTPTQQAARPGVWSSRQTAAPSPSSTLRLPAGTTARYVMVQQGLDRAHLSLAEVQVVGASPGTLAVSPATSDFGAVAVRGTRSLPLTLANTGTTAVTITGATTSGAPFAVADGLVGRTVAPGASITGTVTYSPTRASDGDQGALVVTSDGVTTSTTVALRGSTVGGVVDLAQGRPATQSSTANDGAAGRAVDGSTNGDWRAGSVTHTEPQASPWWQVDLGASRSTSQVVVWNRTDCCTDRLRDYWVLVSDAPFDTTLTAAQQAARPGVWASRQTAQPSPSTTLRLPDGVTGRYVMVRGNLADAPLSLAEVQVVGAP